MWSSRGELSHPRVNETYFRVNEFFWMNHICTVQCAQKKFKFLKFYFLISSDIIQDLQK